MSEDLWGREQLGRDATEVKPGERRNQLGRDDAVMQHRHRGRKELTTSDAYIDMHIQITKWI